MLLYSKLLDFSSSTLLVPVSHSHQLWSSHQLIPVWFPNHGCSSAILLVAESLPSGTVTLHMLNAHFAVTLKLSLPKTISLPCHTQPTKCLWLVCHFCPLISPSGGGQHPIILNCNENRYFPNIDCTKGLHYRARRIEGWADSILRFSFISHYCTLICLVVNFSPSWVWFAHDTNWWLISPCPHLDPQSFQ